MVRSQSYLKLLTLTLGTTLIAIGCTPSNSYVSPPPPAVTVAKPLVQDVTLFIEQNGEMEAVEVAEVRARVRGFIEEITFEPGAIVTEGDLLYQIEKDQYQADKDSADAVLEAAKAAILVANADEDKNKAEVVRAERDLARQEKLIQTNAISQADYDAALTDRDSAAANVRASQASVEAAKAQERTAEASVAQADLNLNYTEVRAPISGRISKTRVKRGNLVENGDTLATVVDRTDVFANFSISDRLMLKIQDAYGKTNQPIGPQKWSHVPVFVQRENDGRNWFRGQLDYVDQKGVQVETGTLGMRAKLDNSDGLLMPGLFVQVRVPIEVDDDALLLPASCIVRNQMGVFAMIVNAEGKVERRNVTLGAELDGWYVIEDGVTAEDRVVVEGLLRARDGVEVEATEVKLGTDESPLPPPSLPTIPDDANIPQGPSTNAEGTNSEDTNAGENAGNVSNEAPSNNQQ